MTSLARRETTALELMDDPSCDPVALDRTYGHFALVNRLVSGWRTVYRRRMRPLARARREPLAVLDVGSGGGDVARALARWSRSDGHPFEVTAIDPDERAHRFATETATSMPGVRFERALSSDLVAEGRRFDVVVSNHVLHHLDASALHFLLADSRDLATGLVVHNDIERSALAYRAYAAATARGFGGSFIHHDGLLSIRRSYRADELRREVPEGWRVERLRPARLLLTWDARA